MSLRFHIEKSLDGFSIDVGLDLAEELIVLFGPSGAGKSLTLKLLSGLVRPDSGFVEVGGRSVFDSSKRLSAPIRERRIGYLFQDLALFPHMTVYRNIAYGAASALEGSGLKARVHELLEVMRLTGLEGRYPHELSGGQKQRAALARTLAARPEVLLLDEPFSALDHQVREKLRTDLLRVHEIFPITTVLVTHDLEEAFMLGTRIAVINNGHLEQFGPREEVFYRPRTRNVAKFVGTRNIFTGVVKEVSAAEAVIHSPDIGPIRAALPPSGLRTGDRVSFCIRPEEIPVVRPDAKAPVGTNLVEGEISSTVASGTSHILFLKTGTGDTLIKITVPNFVLQKLGLAPGRRIKVFLKKESVWIIP